MPLPLLWIGVAAASALAVKGLSDERKAQQLQRRKSSRVQTLADVEKHDSPIAIYPTDLFGTEQKVAPQIGAIVCCGIGGIFDHTGIWIGDNTIVEVDGNGLVKPVSVARFTSDRSGKGIFIACDSLARPLVCNVAAQRAIAQMYQLRDYHLIENNCHHFIWQCIKPNSDNITTFKTLSLNLAQHFDRKIYWDVCDC